jgi:hypothetical protein
MPLVSNLRYRSVMAKQAFIASHPPLLKIGQPVLVHGQPNRPAVVVEVRGRLGPGGLVVYRLNWADSTDPSEAFELPESLVTTMKADVKTSTNMHATLDE